MSELLKGLSREFDDRMALRRRMLDHLGIDLSDETALAYREDLRATMVGCSCCREKDDCALWLVWRRPGTPDRCIASDAFLRLQAVSAVQAEARAAGRPAPGLHRRAG